MHTKNKHGVLGSGEDNKNLIYFLWFSVGVAVASVIISSYLFFSHDGQLTSTIEDVAVKAAQTVQ